MRRHIQATGVFVTLAFVIVAMGCNDEAKSAYAKCIHLEIAGDLVGASVACSAAMNANPSGEYGKAATEQLRGIEAQINGGSPRVEAPMGTARNADWNCPGLVDRDSVTQLETWTIQARSRWVIGS
jgi:hypothetical protein